VTPRTPDAVGVADDAITGVLTDPLGVVVDLLADVETGLSPTAIRDVVVGVAGGRAKRRRLAHAVQQRPGVFSDGRSPAPRVVADLLTALRTAGAVNISAPVCAECGKGLRAVHRRGQDWYCGVHGPAAEQCGRCGNLRPVAMRDHQQRPHCWQCPPPAEPDPVHIVLEVVAGIDPLLPADLVTGAIGCAAPQSGQRRRLAWALRDRPGLLTGDGAHAPVPSVLRLIDALLTAGAHGIIRPGCPHCGRVIALVKPHDGVRLCRNCTAKSRAETCAGCGVHREPATRDEHGQPLCPTV
jgi:hypothetical protein